MRAVGGAVGLVCLLLGACATVERSQPLAGVDHANASPDVWRLQGRLALSNGRDGGSGTLLWSHESGGDQLQFTGALGRGSWRMISTPKEASLTILASGEQYRAENAAELAYQQTGWQIPVTSLAHWVVGEPDPALAYSVDRDRDGHIRLIDQDGWQIQIEGTILAQNGRSMPRKITADKDGNRVRLLVNSWQADPPELL